MIDFDNRVVVILTLFHRIPSWLVYLTCIRLRTRDTPNLPGFKQPTNGGGALFYQCVRGL
jgi:hypothetical protein